MLYLIWLSYINIVFCFREVNEDNMVFRNISAEFLEDTIVLVSTSNKQCNVHIQKSFFMNQEPEQNVNFYYILKNTSAIL